MKTAKQLLETYLAAISAGEMERAIALFADDGGIEFPYFGSNIASDPLSGTRRL